MGCGFRPYGPPARSIAGPQSPHPPPARRAGSSGGGPDGWRWYNTAAGIPAGLRPDRLPRRAGNPACPPGARCGISAPLHRFRYQSAAGQSHPGSQRS